jgi:Flp pilus assembly CpaE family ATPase
MLRAVVISPDVELETRLTDVLGRSGRVAIVKSTERYLVGYELERFLRANAPQVVFLCIQSLPRAMDVILAVEQTMPAVQVVAIDRTCDHSILLDLMRNGVREFLGYPFESSNVAAAISRLEDVLSRKPAVWDSTDLVFSFLPAKAGAGASTAALNASIALSRLPDTNVLLTDLDLNSGLIGFMLKLDAGYTIYEAAESMDRMDEHIWPQLVNSTGALDVLPAGRLDPQTRIEPIQIRHLISFARRFYRAICLDLSGNMEKYSLEVMQESKRIFLVCTPEIPVLHLARQKIQLLAGMDLGDRISVILNRAQKRPLITPEQIQQLLGVPIFLELPNDYEGVHKALTDGREIDPASELGKQFTKLSYSMMEKSPPRLRNPKKRKFLEFFAISPRPVVDARQK